MGHKGNSQPKQALEEDGDQNDWAAADPGEKQGRHNRCLERPHGDGKEPSRLYSDFYHPDKAESRLWGDKQSPLHTCCICLPSPPCVAMSSWDLRTLVRVPVVRRGNKMQRVHSPDRLTLPGQCCAGFAQSLGRGLWLLTCHSEAQRSGIPGAALPCRWPGQCH